MIINIVNSLNSKRRIKSYIKEVCILICTKKGNIDTIIGKIFFFFFCIYCIEKVISKYAYKSRKYYFK